MNIIYSSLKIEYIDSLVKIHRETFKDYYNSRLGNYYTREYLKWFSKKNEFDSFIICASDEDKNKLVSYICGGRLGLQSKLNRDLIFPTIISFLIKPWLVFDKRFVLFLAPKFRTYLGLKEYSEIDKFEAHLKQPIFSLSSFGIDSSYKSDYHQRSFILNDLFDKFFEELRKRNAGTVRATVRKDNQRIIKFYTSRNWILSPVEGDSQTIFFYKELD